MVIKARINADFGKSYKVIDLHGKEFQAQARGKKVHYTCGDWVEITPLNDEQAVIETLLPRENIFYREDGLHAKILVANIEQIFFVIAVEPSFNEVLLQRAILAAEYADIPIYIVLNKGDLNGSEQLQKKLGFYTEDLGYSVLTVSALQDDLQDLLSHLTGKTSLLVGQSGMGKSTIINKLLKRDVARTNQISQNLSSGKHTTTHTIMYELPNQQGFIVDSPGLQKFGLNYLNIGNIINYFPDFAAYVGQCKYHNCMHINEPGCKLKEVVEQNLARADRLKLLQDILIQNSKSRIL